MPGRQRQVVAIAKGRVQGVGYRAFCADTAMRLNVEGQARNLPDGRVEVIAEGDEPTLRQFVERLREGPPYSRVDEVTYRWEDPTGTFAGFEAII
ncbi:MAG: acylphosphatase [Dehalococcoidia bacterium]|nr:acylphosphatase [Dehalococcoidia bacterium]